MTTDGRLLVSGGLLRPTSRSARPRGVNLRSIDAKTYELWADRELIGTIESQYVPFEAHEGAIYLHEGDAFRVQEIDHRTLNISLEAAPDGILTRPISDRYVNVRESLAARGSAVGDLEIRLCRLHVRTRVNAYQEIDEKTGQQVGGEHPVTPVTTDLNTVGIEISGGELAGLHALEHLVRALAPTVVLCDPGDVDGHTDIEMRTSGAAYVFDKAPGGTGLASRLFHAIDDVLERATERLHACDCREGCPRCVHVSSCIRRNDELSKEEAAKLLRTTLAPPKSPPAAFSKDPIAFVQHLEATGSPELAAWLARQVGVPARPMPAGWKACQRCGRPFRPSSWEKGYPYRRHNREKGNLAAGSCPGSPRASPTPGAAHGDARKLDTAASGRPESGSAGRPAADARPAVLALPRGRPGEIRRREALLSWREKRARQHRVPPSRILSDDELNSIANADPKDESQLAALGSFGPRWIESFGRAILRVLESRHGP
jgi:hypothetical protein